MFDRAFSRMVNDHIHGITALPMPTNLRIRLMTVSGDPVTYGTEVLSGGGYVSGSGAPPADYLPATDATPTLSPLETGINVTSWPRAETVVGLELWGDVAGIPTRMQLGDFDTPLVMAIGDNLIIDPGDLASALG